MASKVTLTRKTYATTSQTFLSVNNDRTGLVIANQSTTSALFVRLTQNSTAAATATTAHSWRIAANDYLDLSDLSGRCWKGSATGIWAAGGSTANHGANITELE